MSSFLFREFQLITVLVSICDSYKNWWEFQISIPFRFLLKFIFLFNKMHGLFDFKTS